MGGADLYIQAIHFSRNTRDIFCMFLYQVTQQANQSKDLKRLLRSLGLLLGFVKVQHKKSKPSRPSIGDALHSNQHGILPRKLGSPPPVSRKRQYERPKKEMDAGRLSSLETQLRLLTMQLSHLQPSSAVSTTTSESLNSSVSFTMPDPPAPPSSRSQPPLKPAVRAESKTAPTIVESGKASNKQAPSIADMIRNEAPQLRLKKVPRSPGGTPNTGGSRAGDSIAPRTITASTVLNPEQDLAALVRDKFRNGRQSSIGDALG
eukprot:CAMPEP_0184348528 /NCGR_PEP_ID=MMETSP1089-20130417/27717_1 /TAXON_ID=38269 ORGANISM="Gloeochaete wittrockiana, Strain SAG46.84" /NCGR_SAMPLE_ID=MMETSP1089 /ASSEMBLY_ACC=CAM_ASM_000445 /LENGTH=261 /DNA_ID=CAMNT_0026680275 /DNA_START=47 /DNA_END=832 /DNA_ORIENTATION=-